jgi:hypothetical protein
MSHETTHFVPKNVLRDSYTKGEIGDYFTICCFRHTGSKYLFISDNTSHTANKLYTKKLERQEESEHSKAGFDVFRAA